MHVEDSFYRLLVSFCQCSAWKSRTQQKETETKLLSRTLLCDSYYELQRTLLCVLIMSYNYGGSKKNIVNLEKQNIGFDDHRLRKSLLYYFLGKDKAILLPRIKES